MPTTPTADPEIETGAGAPPATPTEATIHFQKSPAAAKPAVSDSEAAQGTNNISSDTLAKNEVDKIADQLRQRLDTAKASNADEQPAGQSLSATVEPINQPAKDDTIFIDADGQLQHNE